MNRRKILGLLQKDISPLFDVTDECISLWENNESSPLVISYPRIAQFLEYEWWRFDTSTLGGRIQDYRYRHGLTAHHFGVLLSVHGSTVRSWELGEFNPNKKVSIKLNEVLDNTKPLD